MHTSYYVYIPDTNYPVYAANGRVTCTLWSLSLSHRGKDESVRFLQYSAAATENDRRPEFAREEV